MYVFTDRNLKPVVDLKELDLSAHDCRILELLSLKQQRLQAAQDKAHQFHLAWKEEMDSLRESNR